MPELVVTTRLALRGVTAVAPDGTRLLDDVSFHADAGELVAVVGPTGAGKTSLARVLSGALPVASGERVVDGVVAFVPQHDTLHLGLTLRAALDYAAALRLADVDADTRTARVVEVIAQLGLDRHVGTLVRDLSVGQRKRANVAAHLLSDPDVIVLDEPTAGLDPGYERVVRDMLRALADAGRTVVTVTHSVDALNASDRVLFLAAGGAVAFFGSPQDARRFFGGRDAAETFLALDTAPAHEWQAKFRASAWFERMRPASALAAADRPTPPRSRRGHVATLLRRHFALLRGDGRHMLLLALQAPIIGALLWAVLPADGLVPAHDRGFGPRAGIVVLFLVLSTTWVGVTNAVREIVKEHAIVQSEVASGMSPLSYVASKLGGAGAIAMAQSALIAFIATGRQHAPGTGVLASARVEIVVAAALSGLAACALGLAISAIARSADKALAMLPVALVLQLVFAGAWAQDAHVPFVGLVRSLTGARWGMAAMEASLRRTGSDWWSAVAALVALAGVGVAVATWRVHVITRTADTRRVPLSLPRVRLPELTGAAAAAAVVLSLSAGGTGVVALVRGHQAPAALAAPAPTTTPPRPAVLVTTPTTLPAPATTTPAPVALAAPAPVKPRKATPVVDDPIPEPTPVSIPVDAAPTESTPVVTTPPAPVTTPTTNPWQRLLTLFNPLAPRADR